MSPQSPQPVPENRQAPGVPTRPDSGPEGGGPRRERGPGGYAAGPERARDDEVFEQYRPLLTGLAYRLLGSMWDAEDIVQDAYLRWTRTDTATVREPRAFLATVTSRLALDQLRSARVTREAYIGPWLPEPVPTGELGPLDTAELRDTVSYATVHLLQRLSPPERAVFVLREAFALPYEDIAGVVGGSVAGCRQTYHRARGHLDRDDKRFTASREDHVRLLERFLTAATSGDLSQLTALLSEDVVSWNDGGGRVRAALRPIRGRKKVVAFLSALAGRHTVSVDSLVDVNGAPALWLGADDRQQCLTLDIGEGGVVRGIYIVLNPDKLTRVRAAAGA
ncbi:RNA polymerase sigma factor SigJ [Streptomyces sp. NBC_01497]|uniref:RNA polymerase sigma factor SigJ n=1 Tax=Streptomyces sp. NBC_01497 TaxID=2903885 RepID=UPI002E3728C3|nr:RNA polymerase sigma factor SigJ [Streptomyces sp. NBC_01497]